MLLVIRMRFFDVFLDYLSFLLRLFTRMESAKVYVRNTIQECHAIGYGSLLVAVLLSFFLGAVMLLQTAYNLASPLVPPYVLAVVVRDASVTELAPTLIGFMLAGKIGSNITGTLGTMRITEQIDALEIMGINSISYLVLPKVIASLLMFPMLVVISIAMCLVGGYVATFMSEVMTIPEYILGVQSDFIPFNLTFALTKAALFSFIISTITSYKGYYVHGGSFEVGRASTSAITTSYVFILIGDYLLAEIML